jgi:Ca2+-binding EF-hand superfamily protein
MHVYSVFKENSSKFCFPNPSTYCLTGWSARLIGFREVILATENVQNLDDPVKVLRWLFKIYDFDARGQIHVSHIKSIVQQIISLCISHPKDEASKEDLCEAILSDFEPVPYETPFITEEEFVFDSLRNELLFSVLRESTRSLLSDVA